MKHYDYEWDLYPNYLKLDDGLNTDALGWRDGDIFKFVTTENGIKMLKKVDRLVGFLEEGTRNEKV